MRVIFTFFSELFLFPCGFFFSCSEKKKLFPKGVCVNCSQKSIGNIWELKPLQELVGFSSGTGSFLWVLPYSPCLPLTPCSASSKLLPAPGPSRPLWTEIHPAISMPMSDFFSLWIYLSAHFWESEQPGSSLSHQAVACVISPSIGSDGVGLIRCGSISSGPRSGLPGAIS